MPQESVYFKSPSKEVLIQVVFKTLLWSDQVFNGQLGAGYEPQYPNLPIHLCYRASESHCVNRALDSGIAREGSPDFVF